MQSCGVGRGGFGREGLEDKVILIISQSINVIYL